MKIKSHIAFCITHETCHSEDRGKTWTFHIAIACVIASCIDMKPALRNDLGETRAQRRGLKEAPKRVLNASSDIYVHSWARCRVGTGMLLDARSLLLNPRLVC